MVNELRELLHDNVASAPPDHDDLAAVLTTGRRRVRRRKRAVLGGAALATAGIVSLGSWAWMNPAPPDLGTAGVPTPSGPVLRLADAEAAVEGRDYDVLTSYTNENLNADNGQYLDGVTDDGLVLFRDGPRTDQLRPRFALMDPRTGEKDWLPDPEFGQSQTWPVELSEERLVLVEPDGGAGDTIDLVAHVFDRANRRWDVVRWPDLPGTADPWALDVGPDGRLYVPVPAVAGEPPEGGWPQGPSGEVDDSDAEGSTHHLWSVSLTDADDVRDEGVLVGDVAFTEDAMVWTDGTNGDPGTVHVRDLASGEQTDIDPRTGERCNLLGFGAAGDRIVMSQYCGTYEDGVRDDRVQVLTTSGEQVATIQDSDVEGALASGGDPGLVTVRSHQRGAAGTYVYDLASDRFVRVSDSLSSWSSASLLPQGMLSWDTSVNFRRGATQVIAEWGG
jgi:hypothetical protein